MTQHQIEPHQTLVTVREVARLLALSTHTVRSWIARRQIASVRIGKRAIRVPLTEVERVIKSGTMSVGKEGRR